MLDIYVDADGCPVKEEVYRVAKRHGLKAYVVANSGLRIPPGDQVEMVVVKGDFNAADDWIAEHAGQGDIVITADIPLADRALQKGARVIGPTGRPFTDKSIGNALATRELMDGLRKMGEITGGPSAFSPKDRSSFLSRLDETIHAIRKAAK